MPSDAGSRMILGFVIFMLCIAVVLWLPELGLITSQGVTDMFLLGFLGLGIFAMVKAFV
jgi:hypothetical protein